MRILYSVVAIAVCIPFPGNAESKDPAALHRQLKWQPALEIGVPDEQPVKALYFESAAWSQEHIPYYTENIPLKGNASAVKVEIINAEYETFQDVNLIPATNSITKDITVQSTISLRKKQPYACVSFFPFRKNQSGILERLVSFDFRITITGTEALKKNARIFSHNSVLANGSWYKIAVSNDGIYKLNYQFLKKLGLDLDHTDPRNIRIYGNGGGMLPFANSSPRLDDLQENAIYVEGESDGQFNQNDFILFYGQGPTKWTYSNIDKQFHHQVNLYSDSTYYFITPDAGSGIPKRIDNQNSTSLSPTQFVTSFDDYNYHESDMVNLLKSGREWYGEQFDNISNGRNFEFSFPNLSTAEQVKITVDAVAKATEVGATSVFNVSANGQSVSSIAIASVGGLPTYLDYAKEKALTDSVFLNSSTVTTAVQFSSNDVSAIGWLNFIELNARRDLNFQGTGNQMIFRDTRSVGVGNIAQYSISNSNSAVQVWDISDPTNVLREQTTLNGNLLSFTLPADNLHQFIAFNGNNYLSAIGIGEIENQNLHHIPQSDMVILTHPNFISAANQLADFHRSHDHLSVVVVTNDQVYNEYSSGAPDVSAVRDFMKMFYERSSSTLDMPKYLLLMGDASYDNKNRLPSNTNYVLSYESQNSLVWLNSYISDDFFCFLDDNEGQWNPGDNDLPDIGIGRLPVKSLEEANAVVNKIITYASPDAATTTSTQCLDQSGSVFGDWRNLVTFVGDDQDGNTHFNNAQALADYVRQQYPVYNVDKIYLDAYKQETTPGGQRYPDARKAIVDRVQRGTLLITYVGHGGEVGWAHERVLEVEDITGWTNLKSLAAFLTATCEFSRVDDPGRTSAGELVLLNPKGAGIGLYTTSRLALAGSNQTLALAFFKHFFEPINGRMPTMGEIFEQTKIDNGNSLNTRNFLLLGDPALQLAYPKWNVKTNTVNANVTGSSPDTLKALSKVTISGEVQDKSGHKMTSFNGIIYPTVYDKAVTYTTLANDNASNSPGDYSYPAPFVLQKNVLYRGKASVHNGDFTFTFVVPKDISFQYGFGRLSYYAATGSEDANGYYENVVIGGVNSSAPADLNGPDVKLYINDDKFVFGGLVNEDPSLYAIVVDSNGVNTIGNGIGHDITAQLDNDNSKLYVLNDYYQADLNDYQKGSVKYGFTNLADGRHSVHFKVWDVYNNSSEAYTEFVVASSASLALDHVLNYPNPFTTHTRFMFEYNCPCTSIEVMVQIFTVSGKLVKTIDQHLTTGGYRSDSIEWDGLDDYGDRIGRGVYVYKLRVQAPDDKYAEKFEKLVILK